MENITLFSDDFEKLHNSLCQLRTFRQSLLRDDQHTYATRLGEIVESLEEWYEGALELNEEASGAGGFDELSRVYREANSIYESKLSDEAKYDLIFSKKISQKVPFSWYDPDTSYEEDVRYFMNAFREYMSGAPR